MEEYNNRLQYIKLKRVETGARKIGIWASATLTSNLLVTVVMPFHARNIPTFHRLGSYAVSVVRFVYDILGVHGGDVPCRYHSVSDAM